MTVNYNLCVSNSSPLSLFKLLLRWKGSIWKAVWIEYLFYLLAFNVVSCFYRYVLTGIYQQHLTNLIIYIHEGLQKLPMEFMLGFFVQVIVTRWSVLYANIGFIDTLALTISGHLTGKSAQERLWRRNIVRYCVLSQVIVFRDISMQVRNRFPTMDTVVAAGIMMPHEQKKFEDFQNGYGKPWMPFQWALCTLRKARKHGSISSDYLLDKCCEQVRLFRNNMALLNNYDICPIPISYPQIVFLAVYVHFTLAIIGHQPIVGQEKVTFGLHFPLMSSLKFLFYMGWLKVAEALLNPFGEDDDDFETNFLIDRNLAIGFAIVDRCFDDPPEEIPDTLWSNDAAPLYSEQSATRTANPMEGSVSNIELPENVQTVHMVPRADNIEGSVKSKTVSVRRNSRLSNSTATNSLRKRTVSWKHAPPSYEQNVSTIDEMEMDEISLDSRDKTNPNHTVTRH